MRFLEKSGTKTNKTFHVFMKKHFVDISKTFHKCISISIYRVCVPMFAVQCVYAGVYVCRNQCEQVSTCIGV